MKKRIRSAAFLVMVIGLSIVFGLFRASTSQAVVQVLPRLNISGDILKDESGVDILTEDYVLLRKFVHGWYHAWEPPYLTTRESSATPVLWRVMSGDAAPGSGQRRVTLLTNYLVDSRRYNTGNPSQPWLANNTWLGSELQVWLNDANGFLKDFNNPAKKVLVSPSPDGIVGSTITLPSLASATGSVIYAMVDHDQYVYLGDLARWFGSNDSDFDSVGNPTVGPHAYARLAGFKGDMYGYAYWTRSPVTTWAANAWQVGWYGSLAYGNVLQGSNCGVRPVSIVDLGSVVFKSGVDNFELGAPSGYPAGDPRNPYVLVLSGDIPDGMAVTFVSADMPPADAYIDEKKLTLEWDIAISQAVKQWPDLRDFSLLREDGSRLTPVAISADASPKKLILTFGTAVLKDELLALDYNLNTDAISFDVTAGTVKVMNSLSIRSIDNRTGRVVPPIDPPISPAAAFTAQLNRLNASLAPNRVALLASYRCSTGTPIRSARKAQFISETAPMHPLAGYVPLAASFAFSIDLGEGTVGDMLALKFILDTDEIKGLEKWDTLDESEKIARLNTQSVLFVYEYADGRSVPLVGNGGAISWEKALTDNAVSFAGTGITLNYAVIDATERPFICSNALIIPDGKEDGMLNGSVWLMQGHSGDSGGCNSGTGMGALLLLSGMALLRKKR